MTKRRSSWLVCLSAVLGFAACSASPAPGAQATTSPVEQVEQQIAQADAQADPNARNMLLDGAAAALERLAAELDKPDAPPEQRLESFGLRLRQAEVVGLLRAQPYALRLRYLQGTDQDRKALGALAGGAWKLLDKLAAQGRRTLTEWRGDYRTLATVAPEMEDLCEAVSRKLAWVAFYRALGAEDGQERQRMLQQATALASSLIRDGRDAGARPSLLLLRGVAEREAGHYDQASADLLAAIDPNVAADLRAEALFELARNLIEQGRSIAAQPGDSSDRLAQAEQKFGQADKAIEAFCGIAAPLGQAGAVHIELKRTVLLKYLCDARAACHSDPTVAAAEQAKADEAILSFLARHADIQVQRAFLATLAKDFDGRGEHQNLDSLALLSLAARGQTNGRDDPRALLEAILARDDQLSTRLHPVALWHLAFLAADGKDDVTAGRLFGDLAERFPRDALSPKAAVNAAVSYSRAVAACAGTGKPAPVDLRRRFVGALESLLQRDDCKPEGRKWRFELGWQYEKLAEQADSKDRPGLSAKAISAYQDVSSDAEQFMQARHRALELGYRHLPPQGDVAAWHQAATALAAKLMAYAADAADAANKPQIAASSKQLLDWGGQAEFRAAELLYSLPGRRQEAMVILRGLPGRWPGAAALAQGAEFEIRKLLEQGMIDQAAKRVGAFGREHPDQDRRLIQLVAAEIRHRIELLRAQGGDEDRLTNLKRDFLNLAGALYGPLAARPIDQRYDVTQMYAEALVANARAAEALPLLQQCQDFAETVIRRQREAIEGQCRSNLAALKAAASDTVQLRSLGQAYLEALAELGQRPEDCRHGQAVKAALEALADEDANGPSRRPALLAQALDQGYPALRDMRKAAVPADAANIAALARACRALGRHDEAVRYYRSLIDGLSSGSAAYWGAELEYCQCLLEGFASDRQAMKGLVVRLKQLRIEDASMGGLKDRFEAVESQARQLAG